MNEKGPFDAAIQCLTFNDGISGSHRHDSAIRVLEAAGKIEGADVLGAFSVIVYACREAIRKSPTIRKQLKEIRALLESLPDKERK